MLKLLIRPKPHSDESLQQYILRLARCNGYRRKDICKLLNGLGASLNKCIESYRQILRHVVTEITGHSEVMHLLDYKMYYNKFRVAFESHRVKICPLCLFETNRCYSNWHLRHSLVCKKHHCLLVDRCNSCSEMYSEESLALMCCTKCHTDLASQVNHERIVSNQIDKHYLSCESIADIVDKVLILWPYFQLYEENSYKRWSKNKSCSIKELFLIKHEVLQLYNNHEIRIGAFKKMINDGEDGNSICQDTRRLSRFLRHDKYPEFTRFFIDFLRDSHKCFPTRVIVCIWLDRLYKTKIMETRKNNQTFFLDENGQSIVFLKSQRAVIPCDKLECILNEFAC